MASKTKSSYTFYGTLKSAGYLSHRVTLGTVQATSAAEAEKIIRKKKPNYVIGGWHKNK